MIGFLPLVLIFHSKFKYSKNMDRDRLMMMMKEYVVLSPSLIIMIISSMAKFTLLVITI